MHCYEAEASYSGCVNIFLNFSPFSVSRGTASPKKKKKKEEKKKREKEIPPFVFVALAYFPVAGCSTPFPTVPLQYDIEEDIEKGDDPPDPPRWGP